MMKRQMMNVSSTLERILGPSRAPVFLEALMRELGMFVVVTPDDLYVLGDALCRRSSDVAVVGHMAKADALLAGARAHHGESAHR